jgi:mannosyltransferase OCH1-like enzyme
MKKIPNILHMIWIGLDPIPDYFIKNLEIWKQLMPDWEFKVWTNTDLTTRNIDESYLNLINQSNIGAQKADLLRYYIVNKFGGYYVDADIVPERSLDELNIESYDLVVCHDMPWIYFPYLAIGFFGAIPKHPIFKDLLQKMYNVDFSRNDIHLVTGPAVFGDSYERIKESSNSIMLPYWYFYRNKIGDIGPAEKGSEYGEYLKENKTGIFGSHRYAATWI